MSDVPTRLHNEPPEPIKADLGLSPEQWAEWMAHVFEEPNRRKADLLGAVGRFETGYDLRRSTTGGPPIGIDKWDDDVAGRASDLRDKLQAVVKQADNLHALEKQPVLAAARAIDGFRNGFIADLTKAVDLIKGRLTVYLTWKADVARAKAREEAEAAQREAKAKAGEAAISMTPEALEAASEAIGQALSAEIKATAPAADLARVHGALGSVATLTTRYKFYPDESDLMTLVKAVAAGRAPIDYLTFNEKRIGYAIRSEKVRVIPGCTIKQEMRA
jgi:hypothetical protein